MTSVRSLIVLTSLSLVLACLVVLSGCGKAELDKVDIQPEAASLTVGDTQQFSATPIDAKGKVMEDVAIVWSVEGDGGQIDAASGLFTALKPGQATVIATAGTMQRKMTVSIAQEPVASLAIAVAPEAVEAGQQATLTVSVNNQAGKGIADVAVQAKVLSDGAAVEPPTANTNASGQATFTVSTPAKAQNNRVEIAAGGQKATAELPTIAGPPATAQARIDPPQVVVGQEAQVSVVILDKADNPVAGAQVTFEPSGEGASVAPAQTTTDDQGRASATLKAGPSAGAHSVRVSVAGLEPQDAAFQGLPDVPAQLALQSDMPATIAGGVVNLTLHVSDQYGNGVPNAEAQLEASQGATLEASRLSTDANGAASTTLTLNAAPGDNAVTATVAGVEPAQHSVAGRAPTAIYVSPATVTIEMLGEQTFSAVAEDAEGHRLGVTPTWSVIGDNGKIDAEGVFEATGLGNATVTAEYRELKSGAQITIVTGDVATVEVTPGERDVTAGENFQFQAQAFNVHGYPLHATPSWAVTNEVGDIDAVGLFTAEKAGSGNVVATANGQSGQASVTVAPGALAAVYVEPQAIQLKAGEDVQLTARGVDAVGNEVPLEPLWSLTADLGELSPNGAFKALRAGSGEIVVEAGPAPTVIAVPVEVTPADVARVEVDPTTLTATAGEEVVFEATGYDAFNNRIEIKPEWTLSQEEIGQIDAHGSFYARKTGSVQLTATIGEFTAEASITVKPAKVARLTIQPAGPLTLSAGTTVSFTLSAVDAFDNTVALDHEWAQSEPLGSITPDGFFRAEKLGSGNLIARQDDLTVLVPITVTPGKLSTIRLTPSAATLQAGNTQKWRAEGFDAYENPVEIEPAWRVTQAIGEIAPDGAFEAQLAKTGQVIAEAQGVSGSAEVTVEPGALQMLRVTPEQLELTAGETAQLIVVGYDAYGNPTPMEPVWQVPNGMGEISADQVFTARKAGVGRLIIAVEELAEVVDISVAIGPLARLAVQPEMAEIVSGAQETFTAQGFDAGGNPVAAEVAWSVEGDRGAITADGVFTAALAGAIQVQAVAGEVVGAAEVTVTPGPAVALQLTAPASTLRAGDSITMGSEAQDAAGNAIAAAPSWSIEGDIGVITPEGVFTAQHAGSGRVIGAIDDATHAVDLEVQAGDLATIDVSPQDPTVTAGETVAFTATGRDAFGNAIPVEVTWSAQGNLGSIDAASGSFQATTAGVGAVVATQGALAGVSMVTVQPGKVVDLRLPAAIRVAVGVAMPLTAVALDAFGNSTQAPLQWELSGEVGWISEGVLQAEETGRGELVARSGDMAARAAIEVEPGDIVRIDIKPDVLDLRAGDKAQLLAVGHDAYGNAVALDAAWTLEGDIGSLAPSGAFTAGRAGNGRITAQHSGLQGAAEVTVRPGWLHRLTLLPEQAQVASTTKQTFAVKGYDAAGNEVAVQAQWALASKIGTIDRDGQFTGEQVGKAALVAYAEGVVASADVVVTPGPVALLFVTPQPVRATAGEDISFVARGLDAHHNTIPMLQAAWRVAGDIGVIDAQTGVFSATRIGQGKVVVSAGESQGSADVEIHPGAPDAQQSKIVSARLDLPADGKTSADIIVHVQDRFGNPVMDAQVFLVSSRDDIIDQPSPTNQLGIALGHIRSKASGVSEIVAVVESIRISNPIQLTFKAAGAAG